MRRFPSDRAFGRKQRRDETPGNSDSPCQTPAERRREFLLMLAMFLTVAALIGGLVILDP
jgi:hypothetical protein